MHEAHPQIGSHMTRIRLMQHRLVPVPIGTAISHRDRSCIYAQYCRLKLILFKPWRSARDLRSDGQSWESAFNEFLGVAKVCLKNVMDNMQILHECQDSCDDHFAER
ncbi:hypothetical protein BD769DRAFT_1308615, partial [Suillus cothurnatus]